MRLAALISPNVNPEHKMVYPRKGCMVLVRELGNDEIPCRYSFVYGEKLRLGNMERGYTEAF